MELDHIAVAATSLAEGVAHVEAALGVALGSAIGLHAHMSTHNRLLGLGPTDYLEVIAIDPGAPKPAHPRWFRLDQTTGPPRLTNWIARVDNLAAALALAPSGSGHSVDLARGDFRWRMAVPGDGQLPFDDCFPGLIEWQGPKPSDRLADAGCRLTRLEIAHPEAALLAKLLPVTDPRLVFVTGASALRATFSTPHGIRTLA